MSKEYLGDGVYARFDGFQVWLTAENGISVTDEIALEPDVFTSLTRYFEKVYKPAAPAEDVTDG